MPVIEGLGAAAGKFAAGHATRLIVDYLKRRRLKSAYRTAAGRVISYYEQHGCPPRSDAWMGVVSLIRLPACGAALSPDGTLDEDALATLRYHYEQEEPTLLAVVSKLTDEVAKVCRDTLPLNERTVVDVLNAKAEVVRAQMVEIASDTRERVEDVYAQNEQIYEAIRAGSIAAGATTAARSLPRDDDYRVDRPELEELRRRLGAEQVVGIGGAVGVGDQGGVGKSLLAVH